MQNLGNVIKARRQELGLTQAELALKIGYSNKSSVQKLENSREIPIKKLRPIAAALDLDVNTLLRARVEDVNVWENYKEASSDPLTSEMIRLFSPLTDSKKKAIIGFIKNMIDE